MTKILRTEDYSIFKTMKGNRELRGRHIICLELAISQSLDRISCYPILVNENMEIIDGQHRLQALRNLGQPVYYMIAEGMRLKDTQALNAISRGWSPIDYALSYSVLGNKAYDLYLKLKERFGLNHDVLITYIGGDVKVPRIAFIDGKM